jgi:hypothetical protein
LGSINNDPELEREWFDWQSTRKSSYNSSITSRELITRVGVMNDGVLKENKTLIT